MSHPLNRLLGLAFSIHSSTPKQNEKPLSPIAVSKFLTPQDFLNTSLTCKELQKIKDNNQVWEAFFKSIYPKKQPTAEPFRTQFSLVGRDIAGNLNAGIFRMRSFDAHKGDVTLLQAIHGYLFSSGHDGSVKLWDIHQNDHCQTLKGHEGAVHCMAFGQGAYFTGSADKSINVWEYVGDALECTYSLEGHEERISAIGFHNKSTKDFEYEFVFTGCKGASLKVWHKISNRFALLQTIEDAHQRNILKFISDGTRVFTVSADGYIKTWELPKDKFEEQTSFKAHDEIKCCAYHNATKRLVTGSSGGVVKIFTINGTDIKLAQEIKLGGLDILYTGFHFGRVIAVSRSKGICVLEKKADDQYELVRTIPLSGLMETFCFENGCAYVGLSNGKVQVLDFTQSLEDMMFAAEEEAPARHFVNSHYRAVDHAPDASSDASSEPSSAPSPQASVSAQPVSAVKAVAPGDPQKHRGTVTCMKVQGEYLFTGSIDQTIKMRKMVDMENQKVSTYHVHKDPITCMEVGQDQFFTGGDFKEPTIIVWKQGKEGLEVLQQLEGHEAKITSLRFHSACQVLLSGSKDGVIKVWHKEESGYSCKQTIEAQDGAILKMECDKTGFISASSDSYIQSWQWIEGSFQKSGDPFKMHTNGIQYFAYAAEIGCLAVASSKDVYILKPTATGFALAQTLRASNLMEGMEFDNQKLIAATHSSIETWEYQATNDCFVQVDKIVDGKGFTTFCSHQGIIYVGTVPGRVERLEGYQRRPHLTVTVPSTPTVTPQPTPVYDTYDKVSHLASSGSSNLSTPMSRVSSDGSTPSSARSFRLGGSLDLDSKEENP